MSIGIATSALIRSSLLLSQQPASPVLEQLDPPRRAAVLMALLGLVLLGLVMVACIMIGGRWVRRMGRLRSVDMYRTRARARESWRCVLARHTPDVGTSETAVLDQSTDETTAD